MMTDGEWSYGAGIIPFVDRRVMLHQRSEIETEPLTWTCFGGMMEPGESPVQTACRETFEESGIRFNPVDLTLLSSQDYPEDRFTFYTFGAWHKSATPVILSAESIMHDWFPLGETDSTLWRDLPTPLHSGMKDIVGRIEFTHKVMGFLSCLNERTFTKSEVAAILDSTALSWSRPTSDAP